MDNNFKDGVGYKKPPRSTQFQKGRSGNPSGRPRKSPDLQGIFQKVSRQMVRTNGPNGPRRMTKLEASVTQLVNKATTGDLRAAKLLMEIVTSFPELIKKEEPLTIIVRAVDPPKYD